MEGRVSHPAFKPGCSAVVTGAASGIGFAIARDLASRGLNVMLVDRDEGALAQAVEELDGAGPQGKVASAVADVAQPGDLTRTADAAWTAFGDVHVLVNNAAVPNKGGPWSDPDQWKRSLDVNLWGVLHGQMAFVPRMIDGGQPGAIVNLGSKEGITTPPGNAAYSVSKAAIKVLTEQLAHELRQVARTRLTAHLLVPGYTFTPMNFPDMSRDSVKPAAPWTANQVAAALWDGVAEGRFYIICPDNEVTPDLDRKRIEWAAQDIVRARPALSRWHPDFKAEWEAFADG